MLYVRPIARTSDFLSESEKEEEEKDKDGQAGKYEEENILRKHLLYVVCVCYVLSPGIHFDVE